MDFEAYLARCVQPADTGPVSACMEYALMAGGKRMRPAFLFAVLKDYGIDEKEGWPAAAALEMVHTYSLIHDDLPAMDNDDLRRGKPTAHKAFNEAVAILAGDGLLTRAFEVLAQGYEKDPALAVQLVKILSHLAGYEGMVYGQDLDLLYENQADVSLEILTRIEDYKTGKLLTAALQMAAAIAKADQDQIIWQQLGKTIGVAFQIQDDILEVTSSEDAMGKSLSDARNCKSTIVSLLGIEKAKEKLQACQDEIDTLQTTLGIQTPAFAGMVAKMMARDH